MRIPTRLWTPNVNPSNCIKSKVKKRNRKRNRDSKVSKTPKKKKSKNMMWLKKLFKLKKKKSSKKSSKRRKNRSKLPFRMINKIKEWWLKKKNPKKKWKINFRKFWIMDPNSKIKAMNNLSLRIILRLFNCTRMPFRMFIPRFSVKPLWTKSKKWSEFPIFAWTI